jgi:hypothetical protein
MNLPPWENPPADAIVVSGTIDDLAVEHVRDRMERALAACVGLRHVATTGAYAASENHLVFEGTGGVGVTLKPSSDSLIASLVAPTFGIHLKMPPDRSGVDLSAPDVPASMFRAGLASMDAHRIRSKFSLDTGSVSEELIEGLTEDQRASVVRTLHTACAIVTAANPHRSPNAIVRILLPNPAREARIVDRRSSSLFRRSVERELTRGLPSVMGLGSSTHGYVDFEPCQIGLLHRDALLDPMSIMRLVAASGIDPQEAVLSAAMSE